MRIKGAFPVRWASQDGEDGQGVTIVRTEVKYASSTSGTTHPSSGWQTSIPTVADGNYLWTWVHVVYSDGTQTDSYSVARQGIDGRGIQSSVITYCQKASSVSPESIPESEWGSFPSQLTDGYWLYTRTYITYSDDEHTTSYSVSQVGTGSYYAGVAEYYKAGSSQTTPPEGAPVPGTYPSGTQIQTTWSQNRPTLGYSSPYLWNFEISSDSRGNRYVTAAVCIGNFSRGIQSIVETYAISHYGTPQSGRDYPNDISEQDWKDEHYASVPTANKPYQWNKTVTTYNDGETHIVYHISSIKGIDGKGAVYIDLDNENDSILYDGSGQKVSGNAVCNIHLYDNGTDVTSGKTFSIDSKSSSVTASISGSVLTVSNIASDDGYVIVKCVYNSVSYYARMTIKRLQGVDKYELVCTPSSVAYNESTGVKSASSISIQVYKTAQNGTRTLVTSFPPGLGYALTVDGTNVIGEYRSGYSISLPSSIPSGKTSYLVALSQNSVTIDSENIPINRSRNGDDGEDGDDGNGITSDTFFFMVTETPEAPDATDIGWIERSATGCPTGGSESMPYLWQKEHIAYSQTSPQDIISLVSVFGLSQHPQLLEQTAFDGGMDRWEVRNGGIVPLARGEQNGFGHLRSSSGSPGVMLSQRIQHPGVMCSLEPDSYYTLSFFARDRKYVNLTDYSYGFGLEKIYLRAGIYRLQINGHCSQAAVDGGVKISAYLFLQGASGWVDNVRCDITGTTDVTVTTDVLTVTEDSVYRVQFFAYKSPLVGGEPDETVTVNWWRVICDTDRNLMNTYLLPSDGESCALLLPSTWFIDGVAVGMSGSYTDGHVDWRLSDDSQDSQGWAFHSVTFKTGSSIPDAIQNIMFEVSNCYVEVCMPKLERSVKATSWCRNENDSNGECSHNPCGRWQAGTVYYYCNGQRDVVRAPKDGTLSEETWWRLRRKTVPAGYVSEVQPYSDRGHWEPANSLKFTVVDAMFADEIFTDKLITSHAKSDNTGNPKWELNPDGSVTLAAGKFTIDASGNILVQDIQASNGRFDGTIVSRNLRTPFVDGRPFAREHTYSLEDGTSLNFPRESGLTSRVLTLPDHDADFNGVRLSVNWDAKISRNDVGHVFEGRIRCPLKDTPADQYGTNFHEYYATSIVSYSSGFAEFININGTWTLISICAGDARYTEYT